MVAAEELVRLKDQILTRVAEAARAGNVHQLPALSSQATECERLIADAGEIDRRYAALASLSTAPTTELGELALTAPPAGHRSAKRDGAEMRAEWVVHMKSKGIDLQGHGKRYLAPSHATVALAPANELPGKPDRWFSGLPDERTDVAVLLCRNYSGRVHDLVLPVSDLGRRWELLSRSAGQIKFNVRKDASDFLLLVPGNEPLRVTQYLGRYEPLRQNGAV